MLGIHLTDAGRLKAIARKTLARKLRRRRLLVESLEDRRLLAGDQPPNVLSVVRADSNPTNAPALNYTVTFDEPVRLVDTTDLQLVAEGSVTGVSVTQVVPQNLNNGHSAIYTVKVNSGTGAGTLKLNVLDNNSIRDQQNDPLGGNGANNGAFSSGETYTIDKTVPTVANISLIGTPTAASTSIEYNVTFSESVTGVNAGDFQLITSGLTGSVINSVSGSGTSYVVQVGVGSGEGTVQLVLVDDDSIIDVATNALGGVGIGTQQNGPVHSVDMLAPTVLSIVAVQPNPTNASLVDFTIAFSEPVMNVGLNDFSLTSGGSISGAMITNVSGTAGTFIVTVATGSGDGTIQLGLVDPPTITDAAGNAIATNTTTTPLITIDKTSPTSMTIAGVAPAGVTVTNATSVQYQVSFAEPVTGITPAAFNPHTDPTGNLTGLTISSVIGNGSTYLVTIDIGSGDHGPLLLGISNPGGLIQDLAGNPIVSIEGTGLNYLIDRVAPSVTSLQRASPTASTTLVFDVLFSELVSGVGPGDFALSTTGVSGATVDSVDGSGTSYTVIVTYTVGNGTVGLNLVDDNSIVDTAGNALGGTSLGDGDFVGETYDIVTTGSIVGFVTIDADSDGFADASEVSGVVGSVVYVDINDDGDRDAGEPFATVTNSTGQYTIQGVNPGSYSVRVDPPIGWQLTNPAIRTAGSGSLTLVQQFKDNVGGNNHLEEVAGVTESPDGNFVYIAAYTDNAVTVYSRNAATGSLTPIQSVANGSGGVSGLIGAQSIAVTQDGKNLYVASAIDDALVMFARNESTGQLTYLGHLKQGVGGVDGLNEAVAIRESADGKNLYVAAVTSNSLAVFNRDAATGLVTFAQKLTGVTGGSFSVDLSPDQRHVYLSSGNSNAVNVYNRNLTTGQLTLTQTVTSATPGYSALNQPWGISVSPDGKNIYVATKLSQGVVVLNRDEVTGHVSFNEFVPDPYSFANPDPVAVLVSPDGHHVAVTFQTSGGMAIYSRNQTTGKLTLVEFYLDGVDGFNDLRGSWDVEFSNDGRSLYLVTAYEDAVYAFDREVGNWEPSSVQASVAVGQVTTLNTFSAVNLVPMVESITYSGTTPVTAGTADFDVVFSEPVTGVDATDFTFVGSFTGASATGISGSGDTYVLTVSLADGLQGTLSPRTNFNASIVDNEGQPLGGDGSTVFDTINVDRKSPTVLSASRLDSNPTNQTSLQFQLIFSEPVTGLALSDFYVSTSGVVGGTVDSLTGSGDTYVVTISYSSGEGSLSLLLADNDTIVDSVGHPLGGVGPGTVALSSYTVQLGTIEGSIFSDLNSNGVKEANESGIGGQTLYIDVDRDGALDAGEPTAVTASGSGAYSFTGLVDGNYTVRWLQQSPFIQTLPAGGGAHFIPLSVAAGISIANFGVHEVLPGSIQGRLWNDIDEDGVFDVTEQGVVGLTVYVDLNDNGAFESAIEPSDVTDADDTGTTTVDESGQYSFTGLQPGSYSIRVTANQWQFTNTAPWDSATSTTYTDATNFSANNKTLRISPDGNFVYVFDHLSNNIVVLQLPTTSSGSPTQVQVLTGEFTGTTNAIGDIAFKPDGTAMYMIENVSNRLAVFSRNVVDGTLTRVQSLFPPATFPYSIEVAPDGNHLYVGGNYIAPYAINPVDGTLTALANTGTPSRVQDIVFNSDGTRLYAVDYGNVLMRVYSRNVSTGAITQIQATDSQISTSFFSNWSAVLSDDDQDLYVAAPLTDLVWHFSTLSDGTLSFAGVYDLDTDNVRDLPMDLQLSPDGKTLLVALGLNNAIQVLNRDPSNGSLTIGPVIGTTDPSLTNIYENSSSLMDLTPDGSLLVRANARANQIELYRVSLEPTDAIAVSIVENHTIDRDLRLIEKDLQPPIVTSIVAEDEFVSGTNVALFTVTYSESVSGVDASDFVAVMSGGVSGAVVQSVTARSGGSVFDVVVASGTGDGTLGLNLVDNDSILDTAGLALGGIGSGNGDFTGSVAIVERNPLRNIVGTLYSDNDRNGQRDAGEPSVSGLRVYVDTNNNSVWNTGEPFVFTDVDDPATTEVDESGAYRFDGLALSTYTVRVESGTAYYTSAASSASVMLTIHSPADNTSLLGVEPNLTAIRGVVSDDLNGNGIVDLGETGFPGVTVYRDLNNNGVLNAGEPSQLTLADDPATTEINEAGTFDFGQLPLGTSHIRVQVPTGYLATAPTLFSGNITSSVDTFNDVSFLLHENLTSISGTLYNDLNYNGTQDAGEGPQAGFVVYVDANANGVRDAGERFATSAADGTYTITNVPAGNSLVRVVTTSQTLVTSPTIQTERLFVSSGSTLREINPVTGAQISSFSVSPIPTRGASSGGLAFDGTSVFMLDRIDNRILKINPDTGVVVSALEPLPNAFYGGLAYVNSMLYASNNTNERILAIDPVTGTVVNTLNIATINAGTPYYSGSIDLLDGLGESADGTKLLAGTASLQRLIINPATGIVEGAYTDLANQRDLGIAGGTGRIFIGRRDTSSLQIYDAAGPLTATLSGVATADDVAASSITSQGANVTLTQDQQLSGVNFGISASVGTITGRQFNDANNNGSFDAGDVPLAGVTVFVDTNNNNWPDVTEPHAISASDGTYTISGVSLGSKIVRAVSPSNARPADSYTTSNRLFGVYVPSGSPVVYLRELNPVTGAVLSTVPTTIPVLANAPFIEVAFDGERLFYFDSFHDIAYEIALDGTVLEQRPLGQLLSTGGYENVVDFGPVAIHGTIYSVRGSGLSMKLVRYDAEINDFIDVRPITFDWDVSPIGSSTTIPTGYYASSASTDGNSVVVATTDDRVLTIDPSTGIATFSAVPSSLQLADFARETLANETFISNNGAVRVYDSAGNLARTFSNTPIYYALGGGLYRDQHANVTVVAGQTLNNVDLRFKSTRGSLSGTIATSPLGGGSASPVEGVAVYLDLNRNSVLDVGEPQTITNSSGQYAFNDLEPGDYNVRQLPLVNQTIEASAPNYNRLFTRTLANGVATISELDPFTGQVLRQFTTPGTNSFQSGLALHGETLYVSQSGALYALNANTGALLSTTPLPTGLLDGLAILDNKAYVLHSLQNRIYVVDLATKQIQQTIDVAAANPTLSLNLTQSLGENADGNMLAARNNNDVVIIDPQTGVVVSTITSFFVGGALAGAGGETYDQGHFINSIQQSTEVRDRLGLIRRRIPWSFGVTANGYAVANVQATEHRVHVFAEQSISGLDFGNLEQGTVSGVQYVDVNENGMFDIGDAALAGVTVYLDLNNNNLPDASEPQTISAVDGTYTIANVPSGNAVLRTVSLDNHVPIGSYSTKSRLFSTRNLTDATSSTGLRLNLYEISPTNGTIIGQVATSIETTGQQSLAYDGETIIITDNFRHKLVEMATDGTIVDEVDLPMVASTPVGVMGPVVVEGTIYLLTYDNGLGYTWRTFDKHTNEFSGAKLLVLPENPPYGNPFMTIALSESPDGKSALAFNYQSQRVYVIDPRSATVTQDLSTNNAPSDFYATASIGGNVLVNSSGGRLAVLDAEYRY